MSPHSQGSGNSSQGQERRVPVLDLQGEASEATGTDVPEVALSCAAGHRRVALGVSATSERHLRANTPSR